MTRIAKSKLAKQPKRRRQVGDKRRPGPADPTGRALIAAMQASPHRDIDIEPVRMKMPVRGVRL
jgi:hypothetical protein